MPYDPRDIRIEPRYADNQPFITIGQQEIPITRPQQRMIPIQPPEPDLPIWQVNEGDYDQLGYQTNLGDLQNLMDYTTTAPAKGALMGIAKNDGVLNQLYGGLKGLLKSYTKHPKEAPSGKAIAKEFGLDNETFRSKAFGGNIDPELYPNVSPADIGGFGIDFGADLTNLMPVGAMFAGAKAKGFKKAGRKFSGLWDKKQRFEISDKGAILKDVLNDEQTLTHLAKNKAIGLEDLLEHDELYKNYPEYKNMGVWFEDLKGGRGRYEPSSNSIVIDEGLMVADEKQSKKTLLHEIQHAIQEKEGFAKGGSPDNYFKPWERRTSEKWSKWKKNMEGGDTKKYNELHNSEEYRDGLYQSNKIWKEEFDKRYEALTPKTRSDISKMSEKRKLLDTEFSNRIKEELPEYTKVKKSMQKLYDKGIRSHYPEPQKLESGFESYKRLAGEAEARDAVSRMDLYNSDRRQIQPLESTQLGLKDLIVRY